MHHMHYNFLNIMQFVFNRNNIEESIKFFITKCFLLFELANV